MAADGMGSSGRYQCRAAPNGVCESLGKEEKVGALTEEDEALSLLLEAFPGISLEDLAHAYTLAEGEPNRAGEILTLGVRENGYNSLPKTAPELTYDDESHFCNGFGPSVVRERMRNGGVILQETSASQHPLVHGRPPDDPIHGSSVPKESCKDMTIHSNMRSETPKNNFKLSASAPEYEYKGYYEGRLRSNGSFGNPVREKSAITGSVSSRMLRRSHSSDDSGKNGTVDRGRELNDSVFSWKRKKKKNAGRGHSDEELGSDWIAGQDEETFVHAMFGGELGIDVVRDVLGHFAGDSDKAIETLSNMGSTADSGDPEKVANPLGNLLGYEDDDSDNANSLSEGTDNGAYGHYLKEGSYPWQETFPERLLQGLDPEMKVDFGKLCDAFPTVEHNFLAVVYQAAQFSFAGAVDILKDAGMTPITSPYFLDATDVLQSLFTSDGELKDPEASASTDLPNVSTKSPVTTGLSEPWNVVAAKPRVRRPSDMAIVAERLKNNAHGEWSEYTRQRLVSSEHWENWKWCMKEAWAAYGQGDRARADRLAKKGTRHKQLALEAGHQASQNIFNVQNKDIENNIKIDLHAQHVTEALRLLKLHLRTLSRIPSVHMLTVVTGQGSHSAGGRAKIKPAITKYLDKKKIPWKESNPGCILVNIVDLRASNSPFDIDTYDSPEELS